MSEISNPYPLPQSSTELYDFFNINPEQIHGYEIVAGTGNTRLANEVADLLGKDRSFPISEFPNSETYVRIDPNLRGRNVFVIQSMQPDPNRHIQEMVIMGDAIRRSDTDRFRAIIPKIAYDRQDRKTESRTPISIGAVAEQLQTAGYSSLLTVDIHNEASMVAFNRSWDNLYGSKVLIPAIERQGLQDIVVLAPDAGSVKRAEKYAQKLDDADAAVVIKRRKSPNESQALYLAGDVNNRDVVIVDDVASTGGSIINAGQRAKEAGANRVIAAVTHSELVPDRDGVSFLEKLSQKNNPIDAFITTDTIFQSDTVRNHEKVDVVSVAPMLAVAIMCYLTGESIGKRLIN